MGKKLAIITIHGMGETPSDYWMELRSKLERILGPAKWQEISFHPVNYQSILQANQYRVWGNMPLELLDGQKLRKFLLFSFSDAACLEHKPHVANSPYREAQGRILGALQDALTAVGNARAPVVLVAHSLGSQVLSNYIWDSDRNQGIWDNLDPSPFTPAEIRFLKLKTKRYLFTTGCNIPLFVSGFKEIKAIRKTPASFEWHNYFDKDDVLGWPLRPLSESYRKVVIQDIRINVGGWVTGWNPLCHTKYWKDHDFLAPLAQAVDGLL